MVMEDLNKKYIYVPEAEKLEPLRKPKKRKRDEALWTEYAKAAVSGILQQKEPGDGKYPNVLAGFVEQVADAMLDAHKKRWGHE